MNPHQLFHKPICPSLICHYLLGTHFQSITPLSRSTFPFCPFPFALCILLFAFGFLFLPCLLPLPSLNFAFYFLPFYPLSYTYPAIFSLCLAIFSICLTIFNIYLTIKAICLQVFGICLTLFPCRNPVSKYCLLLYSISSPLFCNCLPLFNISNQPIHRQFANPHIRQFTNSLLHHSSNYSICPIRSIPHSPIR